MEVSIEQFTGEEEVELAIPEGVAYLKGKLHFSSMEELAAFSDGLLGLVDGWRADEKFAALTGIRRQIADALVQHMREQVRLSNGDAIANNFPEDVHLGGQWHIDVQRLDDGPFIQATIGRHVKALIVSIAGAIEAGKQAGSGAPS